jgi:fluoroacetyl-CoA thioesterase
MNEPMINSTAAATLVVSSSDLASALPREPRDTFPAVFATSRMVALMEIASARVLHHCLNTGEMSVGVGVDDVHSAPTPEGSTVTATARYLGRDGKLFEFEVVVTDPGGEVGRARHKRAIINVERLETAIASVAVCEVAGNRIRIGRIEAIDEHPLRTARQRNARQA